MEGEKCLRSHYGMSRAIFHLGLGLIFQLRRFRGCPSRLSMMGEMYHFHHLHDR